MKATKNESMIKIYCNHCGQGFFLILNTNQLSDWVMHKKPVSDLFPDIRWWERELLISRTCKECFEKKYGPQVDK